MPLSRNHGRSESPGRGTNSWYRRLNNMLCWTDKSVMARLGGDEGGIIFPSDLCWYGEIYR